MFESFYPNNSGAGHVIECFGEQACSAILTDHAKNKMFKFTLAMIGTLQKGAELGAVVRHLDAAAARCVLDVPLGAVSSWKMPHFLIIVTMMSFRVYVSLFSNRSDTFSMIALICSIRLRSLRVLLDLAF
jgi:hypothetical protein